MLTIQKIVPSGTSFLSKQTLASNADHFAYAGDSHVYIYDARIFRLEKILPFCEISVTHIKYHPQENILGCVLMDYSFELWDINQEKLIFRHCLEQKVKQLEWNPLNPSQIVFVVQNNLLNDDLRVLDINTQKVVRQYALLDKIITFQWSPKWLNTFALGTMEGHIDILNNDTKAETRINAANRLECIELRWNPGEDLILSLYEDGEMILYSQETLKPVMRFEKQSVGISNMAWLDNVSGDILTCSHKVGALRVWNGAHDTPKEMIKVGPHGIVTMEPLKGRLGVFLLQMKNGEVVVFNVRKRKILFQTEVGHTAQVQRVAINPHNPKRMASVGYDGTLRLWDTDEMKVVWIFEDKQTKAEKDSQINALQWQYAPTNPMDEIVAIGTASGFVKIVDCKKNKVISRYKTDENAIFDIDWGVWGLVACSENGCIYFMKFEEGEFMMVKSLTLGTPVRAVAWNHLNPDFVAAGLFSGDILVITIDKYVTTQTLKGCKDKVLSLRWHPFFEYILASGSCDQMVRVWDIKNNGHKNLEYHKSRVRSLQWNYELPWLLVSGGDDSSVGVWDIRQNKLIYETYEPCISVSSLTSHPKKPFTLVSSHLDNSVIFWDLLGLSDIFQTEMKFLMDMGLLELICDAHDQMVPDIKGKLSGETSKTLQGQVKKASKKLEKFLKIIRFFNSQDGDVELCNMLSIMSGSGPIEESNQSRVFHIQDSQLAYQSRAQELQQISGMKLLGTALAKKEDRLKEAALLMLKSGNFQDYCELQMQVGNFEAAISVAPKVSLKYWQSCINQYTEYLANPSSSLTSSTSTSSFDPQQERINYLLLINRVEEAASLLHSRGETQDAKTVKALQLMPGHFFKDTLHNHERTQTQSLQAIKQLHELGPNDKQLEEFTDSQAKLKFIQNSPVLSAAIHLSLSDVKKAIQKLLLSNNLEYGFAVASVFFPKALDYIITLLFNKALEADGTQLALKMIEGISGGNQVLKSLLTLSHEIFILEEDSENEEETNLPSAKLVNPAYSQIVNMLLTRKFTDACTLAISSFAAAESGGVLTASVLEDFYYIGLFDLDHVPQEVFHKLLQCYLVIGVIKALYFRIFYLFRALLNIGGESCMFNTFKLLKAQYCSLSDEELTSILESQEKLQAKEHAVLAKNLTQMQDFMSKHIPLYDEPAECKHNWIHVSLKIERDEANNDYSKISGRVIKTVPGFMLEDENEVVNLEEALDLALVMPFSPITMTCKRRIIPY